MPIGRSATKYATTIDAAHIAYQVAGDGPADLVWLGTGSHLDVARDIPQVASYVDHLASFSRLICFDYRGLGQSDPLAPGKPMSLDGIAGDLLAVLDAVGSDRVAVLANGWAGLVGIVFAASYPQRISSLVLDGCFARAAWAPDYPGGLPVETIENTRARAAEDRESQMDLELEYLAPSVLGNAELEHQVIAGREVLKDADLAQVPEHERGRYWSFGQVGHVLNRGRRSDRIPWVWVSDGGAGQAVPLTFADRDELLGWLIDHVLPDQVMPDVLADQPQRVEVSCEAVDLMRLAGRITKPLGVACYSAMGWGGPEPARDAGLRWAADPRPVVVVSLGDLDPEGIGIVERNFEDAAGFTVAHVGARPELRRIAVTDDQVRDWGLSAGPAKTSHRHGLHLPVTCEADAIPPERLRDLLVSSIEGLVDAELVATTRDRWETEIGWLADTFAGLRNGNGG